MSKNHSMDRRSFLKSSLSGATGLVILGAGAGQSAVQQEKPQPKVVTRILGKTGLKLPVVSMGVMNADNPQAAKLLMANSKAAVPQYKRHRHM